MNITKKHIKNVIYNQKKKKKIKKKKLKKKKKNTNRKTKATEGAHDKSS